MKTSKFYTEERASVVENMEAIVDTAKVEGRELTDDETTNFDSLNEKASALEAQAKRASSFETLQASKASKVEEVANTPKEIRDYSFQDAMKAAYSGKLEGLVAEMDQEARNEARYTGQSYKGIAIPASILTRAAIATAASAATEVMSFTDQLDANLVLTSAGANLYTGVNDAKFPVVSGITSSWVTEDSGSDVAATGATGSLTLEPHKLISVVDMSAEAMTQNPGLEAAIRRNMAASIAATWEKALLAKTDVGGAAPVSIFADAAAGATGVTAADFIAMEATVLGNDVPLEGARMAYLFDKDAYSSIRVLDQTSVAALWDPRTKELNNYFGFFSTNAGNGGTADKAHALFGDFSKCHLAQFGGLDILFDPYTKSRQGLGSMVVTSLVDGDAVQNDKAFSTLIEA
jgi:HK97 family phage major capsid protein